MGGLVVASLWQKGGLGGAEGPSIHTCTGSQAVLGPLT